MGKIDADNKGRCLVYSIQLQKVSELARRGETKRQAGDFVGAISDFDLALQLDPHDVSALRSRGDAKRMLDDFAGAIEDLDAALKLEPRNAFALRSRGDAKRMVDDHMGAIHDLDLALQLEPRNPVALSSRGDAKRMLEDSMGAIADLDIAIQMDPKNAFALSSRAASKRLMGDFLGAIADLDRALEMDPTDAFALRHRGEAKRLARDFVGAIQDLDLALVIEPANALALWRRGEAKRQQGDVMGAMGDLNLALQLEPINATALCSRSDTKLMLQDYMGAMEDLDAAVQLEPANAAALRSRGELKRLSGDFQGSIEDLDRSLQLEPQNAVALSSRGDAKRMLDDCQGALADLDLALELDPNNALDLARRGEVKREQGDFAGAINDLDFALELEPRNVVALSSRGDAKRMLNDCVGALEDLDLALQIEPDNPFALCCRGEAKKIEESRWFVQKADSLGPLNCLMSQQLKWAIIGAGPVGLTLALTLAESMQSRGLDPEVATVEIYLSWIEQDNSKWQRKRGTLSVEMVTLQDPVLDSLSPELRSAFTGGSSPRPSGRSAPVAGIEMKLLEKAQQPPFNTYIRIHDYAETDVQPMWLSSLCCDVIVSDSALTRRAFPGAFVNPAAPQVDVEAQQLPLSDAEGNESNLVEADFALGINLSFGASKQARFNAIFSMAQNIYQLSSDEVSDSGNGRRARDQVVTLQDSVVELLSPDIQSAFEGENVWLQSRNVPVAEIEEKLLEKAQQAPYKEYIRIHQCDLLSDEQQHAEWIKGLDADFVVAADGAASLSRRAFPDAFVYCVAEGANRDAQQIRLGETASEFDEADYALGIALKPETTPPQKQALNVVLTLAQNVYLLNSQEVSRGFLNIRVTKEEYDAIFLATGNRGCTFGSPIRLFKEEDLYLITDDQPSEIKVQLPWLRRRIEEGLKLFGMQLDHMQFITGFQLRPSYAQCSYHVLPSTSSTAQKVLLLAGDAAISHHFWPGRGLNTGLKSAAAIVKMWCHPQATAAEGLKKYDIFMGKLRQREMQGRSASMMRNEMRLPWGSTLLSPKSPEAQQLKRMAVEQEPVNRQKFLKNCKLWRDFLERSPGWPHERLTDKELEERIVRRVIRPKELELRLMLSSAFDNGPGRAAGWPTSMQGGSEVDPSHEEHWK